MRRADRASGRSCRASIARDGGAPAASGEGTRRRRIIPSVGCPMGCNFCTTSAFFGGKGKFLNFYESGRGTVRRDVRDGSDAGGAVVFRDGREFPAARTPRDGPAGAHESGGQGWALYVFSSANAIAKYTMQELVELGVSWIWMGLESPQSCYAEAAGRGHAALTRRAAGARHQAAGIDDRGVGASHAGEHRGRDRARGGARYGFPPVHAVHAGSGDAAVPADGGSRGGCWRAWIRRTFTGSSSSISARGDLAGGVEAIAGLGVPAGFRDAMVRACTGSAGPRWRDGGGTKTIPDARVRERFASGRCEACAARTAAALWAMERRFRKINREVSEQIHLLRREVEKEFGGRSRAVASVVGPILLWTTRREEKRLAAGQTYEPPVFVERTNWVWQ